ncbi:hypothetical protein [Halobacillus litoralis]|uniref:Uncharacterized protein n=1 Tax=Halobacillus litoralis TaxID=45668 RepID=A0A410MBD6_9BACI|nr:hypothetical protein [Halobacillus litoralis]QAS51993.1 hypothetical protein HLI_07035 [Halobacillus litoralis]
MYPIYYIVVILVSIIALISTIVIAKNISKDDQESSPDQELELLKSESKSSNSIPMLTTIYTITFVLVIILMWIFIF